MATAAVLLTGACIQLTPGIASADPTPESQATEPAPEVLHNVTYRARIDGVSRGATITYSAEGGQTLMAEPTMVPGRVFEAQTVLPASAVATMRLSIDWPYSANLHCEVLIDDALASQADDFVAPRVLPQRNDPDFGSLTCEAPLTGVPETVPTPDEPPLSPAEDHPPAA
ncbi:MAG: hypothetical protein WBB07_19600 [Mycobacterium sp.]